MSFDEQPDPLSDALEAYDKLKKLCLQIQQERDSLRARLAEALKNIEYMQKDNERQVGEWTSTLGKEK